MDYYFTFSQVLALWFSLFKRDFSDITMIFHHSTTLQHSFKKKKLEVPSAKSLCTTSRSQLLKLNLQFTRDLQSIEHSLCINRDVCSQKHRRAQVGSIFASLCPALTPAGPPTADAQAALEDLQGGIPISPWSLCQCSATHTALKCR